MDRIKSIRSQADIDEALSRKSAVVFKHSTRCGVSSRAKQEYETFAQNSDGQADLYLVDVIADRGLSEEIARRTGIRHESPQALFIHEGNVTDSITHYQINTESLARGVRQESFKERGSSAP